VAQLVLARGYHSGGRRGKIKERGGRADSSLTGRRGGWEIKRACPQFPSKGERIRILEGEDRMAREGDYKHTRIWRRGIRFQNAIWKGAKRIHSLNL